MGVPSISLSQTRNFCLCGNAKQIGFTRVKWVCEGKMRKGKNIRKKIVSLNKKVKDPGKVADYRSAGGKSDHGKKKKCNKNWNQSRCGAALEKKMETGGNNRGKVGSESKKSVELYGQADDRGNSRIRKKGKQFAAQFCIMPVENLIAKHGKKKKGENRIEK